MGYRSPKSYFHQYGEHAAREVAQQRRDSDGVMVWPFPMSGGNLFVSLTPEILALSEKIGAAEAKLAVLWGELPLLARGHVIRRLLIDEIQATNEIENVFSTRQEIESVLGAVENAEPALRSRLREMVSQFSALAHAKAKMPTTIAGVRGRYDELLGDEISNEDAPDGEVFRARSVHIFDSSGKRIHSGLNPESVIAERMDVFLRTVNDDEAPRLLSQIVGHFMFEYVHPFYDGNGRLGRYLLALGLADVLSIATALSVSTQININKVRYYKAFSEVEDSRNFGDATMFVQPMLRILLEAQRRLLGDLELRRQRIDQVRERLKLKEKEKAVQGAKSRVYVGLFILAQVELFGWPRGEEMRSIAQALEVTPQTVRKDMNVLEEQGFVRKTAERPLMFALSAQGRRFVGLVEEE